jgi:hypothetical protein
LVAVGCTGKHPADLQPTISVDTDSFRIEPMLLNPGDMLQFNVVSEGLPGNIELTGRATDLKIVKRARLPFPPGSGPEGEMQGMDYFMMLVAIPGLILAVVVLSELESHSSAAVRVIAIVSAVVITYVLYPLQLRRLARRRALWRPS